MTPSLATTESIVRIRAIYPTAGISRKGMKYNKTKIYGSDGNYYTKVKPHLNSTSFHQIGSSLGVST
ncbi:hypothetical protein M1590_02345 [Candidatus Marsarchaeota archaeon]|nr:hypothetical protein [Candidatus Marsarchaeota archaeon]